MARPSRRSLIAGAALVLLVAVPTVYLNVRGRDFPPDTTPQGAYLRIALAVRDDDLERAFSYLETEAQWAAFSLHACRQRSAARVRETYPEAEARELLQTLLPAADAVSGPAMFALYAKRKGWVSRLRKDLSGVARVEIEGERATVETARGTRYPFRKRENGIWGLTLFTAELKAEAERAARDDEVVEQAANDYRAARPKSSP